MDLAIVSVEMHFEDVELHLVAVDHVVVGHAADTLIDWH